MSEETQGTGHGEVGAPLPPKPVTLDQIEDGVRAMLRGLGQSGKPEVMANTPRRVAEMFETIINAPWCDIEIPWKTFPNEKDGKPLVEDLIMVLDCHYVSMCEHHLAPAVGVAHVAYVPDKKITGYSKLKKGLNYIARQPQLNERITRDVLDAIESVLEPKGCALITHSSHMCLMCKTNGPGQEIVTIQDFRGCLKEDPWRSDFTKTAYGRRVILGPTG